MTLLGGWFSAVLPSREPGAERGDGPDGVPSDGDAAVPDLVPRSGSGLDQRVHPGLPADDGGRCRGHLLLHQVGRACAVPYRNRDMWEGYVFSHRTDRDVVLGRDTLFLTYSTVNLK